MKFFPYISIFLIIFLSCVSSPSESPVTRLNNNPNMLSIYIRNVMNPTMDGADNTVHLENDEFILLFEPDMVYTQINKKTENIIQGRRGFIMNIIMTEGKLYLYETDIESMSRQQFLASDYRNNSQTILVPINCTGDTVTYLYERPIELRGNEITFTIREIKNNTN